MAKIKQVTQEGGKHYGWSFLCPGCGERHVITTDGGKPGHDWKFNSNVDAPTFSPSLLSMSGHYVPGHKPGDRCWCVRQKEHPNEVAPFKCGICHSFITDGKIQFLNDCTHSLRGQTVPLPEIT